MTTKADVEALLDKGLSRHQIAKRLGCMPEYVSATIRRNGWGDRVAKVKFARPRAEDAAERRVKGAASDLLAALKAIKAHGELACVDAQGQFSYTGGKKPATKEVFQFPRHMLADIDAAIAKAEGR